MFGDGGQVGVVLDDDGAAEGAAQPGAEVESGPAGHRGAEFDDAFAVDDAGGADGDLPQAVAGDAGLAEDLGDGGADLGEAFLGLRGLVDGLGVAGDHLAGQVGEDHAQVVDADLDAEDVSGLGAEAEPAGRAAALTARLLDVFHLGDQSGFQQAFDDAFDGGSGQAGVADQLGERDRLSVAQRPQGDRRIDPPQQ